MIVLYKYNLKDHSNLGSIVYQRKKVSPSHVYPIKCNTFFSICDVRIIPLRPCKRIWRVFKNSLGVKINKNGTYNKFVEVYSEFHVLGNESTLCTHKLYPSRIKKYLFEGFLRNRTDRNGS